jgi:ankyrin repeat protein
VLLKNAADLGGIKGKTPLHYISIAGDVDTFRLFNGRICSNTLRKDVEGRTPMHYACIHDHGEFVGEILACLDLPSEKSTTVDCKDNDGMSPLHHACFSGCASAAQQLVDNRADINLRDQRGRSPLHYACERGALEIVALLLQHGAVAYHRQITERPSSACYSEASF